jgi:hypothetical protein
MPDSPGSQHVAERVPLKQIAELQIFADRVEALVASETLEFGRVLHPGPSPW